jgi:serine O-acetyltransferase
VLDKDFMERLYLHHQVTKPVPPPSAIRNFVLDIQEILFPALTETPFNNKQLFEERCQRLTSDLKKLLSFVQDDLQKKAEEITDAFFKELPAIYDSLMNDAAAIERGDPAAKNINEVICTYPGFYAITIYRLAHVLHRQGVPFIPRVLTEYAHSKTGVDIHPAASIASGFCIDHGTGIVIGETTTIGKNVKIYQGVTLGALSVSKELANQKRHPTIEDDVVIYAGATILGGNTIIGKGSVIGGNVWLTRSVPANSVVYHKAEISMQQNEQQ